MAPLARNESIQTAVRLTGRGLKIKRLRVDPGRDGGVGGDDGWEAEMSLDTSRPSAAPSSCAVMRQTSDSAAAPRRRINRGATAEMGGKEQRRRRNKKTPRSVRLSLGPHK